MTPAFFYLLGQNVTFLSVSWILGLALSAFLALACFFFFSYHSVWIFVGWFSCAPLVLADMASYAISLHPDHEYALVTHFFELLMFVVFSWLVSAYDQLPLLWALQLVMHGCYVLCVHKINTHSGRIRHRKRKAKYYHFHYACLLLGSDAAFLVISIFFDYVPELAVFLVALTAACATRVFIGVKIKR
jgi:hypothetical protein